MITTKHTQNVITTLEKCIMRMWACVAHHREYMHTYK